MRVYTKISLFILISLVVIKGSYSTEELRLTTSQKQKLDRLRELIRGKMPHKWMEEDIRLTRYLKVRVWDVRRAADTMMQTAKWWKKYKMDEIHQEDWSEYAKDYPIHTDGVDKFGQPIMAFSFGEWDMRKAALQGRIAKVARWLFKNRDDVARKSRENWKAGRLNATQYNFIMDLTKFNQREHLCTQCLQFYTEFTATDETHYPAGWHKIILVNTPSVFEVVLSLVRPLFSPYTAKALEIHGTNKGEWEPKLYANITRDQLPPEFGGTRTYA